MDPQAALILCDLFADLDRRALRALAEASDWRELRGGERLYRVGDDGDALYLVVQGRLRVVHPGADDADYRFVGEIGRGETVGEISVLTGEPRTAEVFALRDSSLLRIGRESFERLLHRHPEAMLRVARQIVGRMRADDGAAQRASVRGTRTYAVLPAHPGLDVREFSRLLTRALAALGPTLRLDPRRVDAALGEGAAASPFEAGNRELLAWLNRLEDSYRHLVYQADSRPDPWTRRCLRQADRILVLADADTPPGDFDNLKWLRENLRSPVDAVLLGEGGDPLGWRHKARADFHHRVRKDLPDGDMARLARLIAGRGLCLVLGGGGARGFAHVGLVRALREKGLAVDAVAGTSMGALVAALIATGMDSEAMLSCLRETFVDNNLLNDYSVPPRISLIGGNKFRGRLESIFGDTRIEDLALPYYCVSTNLTRGVPMVHDRGLLWGCIGASMTVPGITPPMVYRGELLVDGGLLTSIPFDRMLAMGRGPVVASDVSRESDLFVEQEERADAEAPVPLADAPKQLNLFRILFHTATLTSERETRDLDERADLVLHMPVSGVGMFDWDQIDGIVYRAYHHADEVLDRWLESSKNASGEGDGPVPRGTP